LKSLCCVIYFAPGYSPNSVTLARKLHVRLKLQTDIALGPSPELAACLAWQSPVEQRTTSFVVSLAGKEIS
jgi:hypothetical protein